MRRRTLITAALGGLATLSASPGARSATEAYANGEAIYAALRRRADQDITLGGRSIRLVFADGAQGLDREGVIAWVEMSATAVATYFGQFPVQQVGLLVAAQDGARIQGGTTFGYDGSAIRIHVGRGAGPDAFRRDAILVHEMIHLALPTLPRRSLWLQEGAATYVEPIARAQNGQLDPAAVWRWALRGVRQGQPGPSDHGLDATRSNDRIYWGGATFWLLADIAIRHRTQGVMSVQTALRAINARSGGNTARWTAGQMLATGDAATHGADLAGLYARMRNDPYPLDAPALFARLGVRQDGDRVAFDDSAPLARVRQQITSAPQDR